MEIVDGRSVYYGFYSSLIDRTAVEERHLQPTMAKIVKAVCAGNPVGRSSNSGAPIEMNILIRTPQGDTVFSTSDEHDCKSLLREYKLKNPEKLAGRDILVYLNGGRNCAVRYPSWEDIYERAIDVMA